MFGTQVATASEEAADLSNKELIESLIRQRDSATELCKARKYSHCCSSDTPYLEFFSLINCKADFIN